MKYALLGLIAVVVIAFYAMSQSNKSDAERLKQAEMAHQQKLEQDRVNEERLAAESKQRLLEAEKAKSMKAEQERVKNEAQTKEFAQKSEVTTQESKPESGNKYSEEEWLSICKSAAGTAKAIMSSRQKGVAMTEMMNKVVGAAEPTIKDTIKALVIEAYNRPRYSSPEYKLTAERDFEDYAYLNCIKAR